MLAQTGAIFLKRWYEDSVGLHLTRAARLHRARAQAMLRDMNLHPGQENVLQVLLDEDGQPMSRLARELQIKPPTLTKMVSRMAGQDLVRRVASDSDGRSATIHLTDAGRGLALDLKQRWKTLEQEALGRLGDKDRKRLVKLLAEVEKGLREAGGETGKKPKKGKPPADAAPGGDASGSAAS